MRRCLALLGTLLATATGVVAVAPPAAAAPGFAVRFTELPDAFAAGAAPVTVAVVVATDRGECRKVRWSMLLRVDGLRLNQTRVERIEETGPFPVNVRTEGNVARLTDVQLDPGTLCPGRTVTARYRIAFTEPVERGQVTLAAEAYTADQRLLASGTVRRPVIGTPPRTSAPPSPRGNPTTAAPEVTPSENDVEPSAPVEPSPPAAADSGGTGGGAAISPTADSRNTGLPLIGFLVGAVLVFFGASLLVRATWRMRRAPAEVPVTNWRPGQPAPTQVERPRRRTLPY